MHRDSPKQQLPGRFGRFACAAGLADPLTLAAAELRLRASVRRKPLLVSLTWPPGRQMREVHAGWFS